MTSTDPWAEIPASAGNYVKWDEPGKTIVGTVTSKGRGTDLQGQPCPEIGVRTDTGEDHTISASQAALKATLLEKAAEIQIGARIAIKYVGDEKRDGGKTLKRFEVQIKAAPEQTGVDAADLL